AAYVCQVAVGVSRGHVSSVIVAIAHGARVARGVIQIPLHEPERTLREVDADLAFLAHATRAIQQHDPVSGQRPPHRAGLDRLPRGIADLCGGLGLAVAVADRDAPALAPPADHLGIRRLPAPAPPAGGNPGAGGSLWDNLPPTGRRGAE